MTKQVSILLVDDDVDLLESTQYMLMNHGFIVYVGKNGKDAIEMYKEHTPDITFLDIKMPEIDGYEAFLKIKDINPKAKIIFTSSFAVDKEKYALARKHALLDMLKKPFSIDDIKILIDKYLQD